MPTKTHRKYSDKVASKTITYFYKSLYFNVFFLKLVVIFIRDKVFLKYVLRSCFVKNKDVHYYLHVLIKLMIYS